MNFMDYGNVDFEYSDFNKNFQKLIEQSQIIVNYNKKKEI